MAKAKGFQPSPVGLSVSRDVAHKALTLGVLHILRRPQFPQALRYMRGAMAPTYWYKCTKERRHCQVVWAWAAWGADFPYPSPKQGLASIPVAGSQGYYARFDNSPIYFHSFALYYVCSKENGHTASSWRARPVNWLLYRSA